MRLWAAVLAIAIAGCGRSPATEAHHPTTARAQKPRGESRVERMLRGAEAYGYSMARATVPLGEIPRATVPRMLDAADAERTPRNRVRLALSDLAFVEMKQESWSCPIHHGAQRGLCAACGARLPRAMRSEGPVRASAVRGTLRYEIVDAIYDPAVDAAVGEPRLTVVVAKEILPNLLYAFRFVDEREPGIELVSFVLPPVARLSLSRSRSMDPHDDVVGTFSRATLAVGASSSESILARITTEAASAWMAELSPKEPPAPADDLVVGLELSSAGTEPEPQVVAYVSRRPRVEERE